ncbi:MAG TPA: inositol monophosphatase family protein [Solirubrobacteraceae bacterium]|nr:inositol monophosphatase family protein [Solirubrobacteraceae bacterium]
MGDSGSLTHADWLHACRRASAAIGAMLAARSTTAERAVETGATGSGGDHTLEIDDAAESLIFAELERLHRQGHRFNAISEERGAVDFGDPQVLVVIDPIDGSLNAKRGLSHHALSVAVATGTTMADVQFGFVHDFGPGEEWWAAGGEGAFLNDRRLDPTLGERRGPDGRIEVVGIESADPRWLKGSIDILIERAYRLRALGAIAPSLCQVAAGRFDGLVSLRGCRAVDAAAAQLVVREAGGLVSFPKFEHPLAAPLDLVPHSPVVAARTDASLAELEAACLPR